MNFKASSLCPPQHSVLWLPQGNKSLQMGFYPVTSFRHFWEMFQSAIKERRLLVSSPSWVANQTGLSPKWEWLLWLPTNGPALNTQIHNSNEYTKLGTWQNQSFHNNNNKQSGSDCCDCPRTVQLSTYKFRSPMNTPNLEGNPKEPKL